jgi:hypothetical protein
MVDLRITGADQLKALGAEFKKAGAGDLRKEMLRDFRAESAPLISDIRASASDILPRRGGLGARVAKSKIRAANRLSGSSVGMRITGTNRYSLKQIDAGTVRHLTFGHKPWKDQAVRPGWFDKPFKHGVDDLRRRVIATMDRFAAKLGGH